LELLGDPRVVQAFPALSEKVQVVPAVCDPIAKATSRLPTEVFRFPEVTDPPDVPTNPPLAVLGVPNIEIGVLPVRVQDGLHPCGGFLITEHFEIHVGTPY